MPDRNLFLGRGKTTTALAQFFGQAQCFSEEEGGLRIDRWAEGEWHKEALVPGNFDSFAWEKELPGRVVLSPGINPHRPFFEKLKAFEERELDLFCKSFSGFVIGITGTNGKSSFTTWLGQALQKSLGEEVVFVGGNLGKASFDVFTTAAQVAVLELSSFQLERLVSARFDLGILLNLAPDHLGRYENLSSYYQTKWNLIRRSAHCFYPNDVEVPSDCPASEWGFESGTLARPLLEQVLTFLKPRLEGNWIPLETIELKPLPHRWQLWSSPSGIVYINDSKATNVASACYGLKRVREWISQKNQKGQLHLIFGGRPKGEDFGELKAALEKTDHVHLYGEAVAALEGALSADEIQKHSHPSLKVLLRALRPRLKKGDIVLFSPACASFDEFSNFEVRGAFFLDWASREES